MSHRSNLSIVMCAVIGLCVATSALHIITVPIEASGNTWTGNFTVGSRTRQQLTVSLRALPIFLYRSMYKPSQRSKDLNHQTSIEYGSLEDRKEVRIVYEYYADILGIPGLSVPNATFLIVKKTSPTSAPPQFNYGALGLGPNVSGGPMSNFPALCAAGFTHCRFGIVLETERRGQLVFGEVDQQAFEGNLITSKMPYHGIGSWITHGDIATKDKIYTTNALVSFDIASREIIGPSDGIRQIFADQSIKSILTPSNTTNTDIVHGEFACDRPPSLGFNFEGKTFYIAPSALIDKHLGNNRCRSIVIGDDARTPYPDGFAIGSSFFVGRYIDFNNENQTIGFANLKESDRTAAKLPGHTSNSSAMRFSTSLISAIIALALTVFISAKFKLS